jgi:hypothetical protein
VYWCTRHTFASHWVLQGRSIEKLSKILGHYSVVMTERYAHLRPELFIDEERAALPIDLTPGTASVAEISVDSTLASPATPRHSKRKAGAAL